MSTRTLFSGLLFVLGLIWVAGGFVTATWYEVAIGVAICGLAVIGYRSTPPKG